MVSGASASSGAAFGRRSPLHELGQIGEQFAKALFLFCLSSAVRRPLLQVDDTERLRDHSIVRPDFLPDGETRRRKYACPSGGASRGPGRRIAGLQRQRRRVPRPTARDGMYRLPRCLIAFVLASSRPLCPHASMLPSLRLYTVSIHRGRTRCRAMVYTSGGLKWKSAAAPGKAWCRYMGAGAAVDMNGCHVRRARSRESAPNARVRIGTSSTSSVESERIHR